MTDPTFSRYLQAQASGTDHWQVVDVLQCELGDYQPMAQIGVGAGGFEVSSTSTPGMRTYFPSLSAAMAALEAGILLARPHTDQTPPTS